MLLEKERNEVRIYGNKMLETGLTHGTGGNISVFNKEKKLMAISPSGINYPDIKAEDVVIIDINTGRTVDGNCVPSSESDMHRIFYKYRDDIFALVHTHSVYATAYSCTGLKLDAIHYLLADAGVDVRCAPYETYGTVKLAKVVFENMIDRKAVLLSNHGMLAGGRSIADAFSIAGNIEYCCQLYFIAKVIGTPQILPEEEMHTVIKRFKDYGKRMEEHDEI